MESLCQECACLFGRCPAQKSLVLHTFSCLRGGGGRRKANAQYD